MKRSGTRVAVLMAVVLCLTGVAVCMKLCCVAALPPREILASEADVQRIFSEFAAELEYIEEKHSVTLDALTEDTLELIKEETILNLSDHRYRFASLMDEISLAMLKQQKAEEKALTRTATSSVINETYTTIVPYQALKGAHSVDVPVGTTVTSTKSVNVTISSGEIIKGITLTSGYSKTTSYTIAGPAFGATLSNGLPATHTTGIGVAYGSISRYDFDLVTTSGLVHGTHYVITPGTKSTVTYTFATNLGIPTYAQKPCVTNTIATYETLLAFYQAIESNPGDLLS